MERMRESQQQEDEDEGEKDTDERRESSGKAPRLGAPAKGVSKPWALLAA